MVQKRHHTRFFPGKTNVGRDDRKNNNVPAGTIVDQVIVRPTENQFYLVSHQSIQGVAKPTKYCILKDDGKHSIDDLQELTYNVRLLLITWITKQIRFVHLIFSWIFSCVICLHDAIDRFRIPLLRTTHIWRQHEEKCTSSKCDLIEIRRNVSKRSVLIMFSNWIFSAMSAWIWTIWKQNTINARLRTTSSTATPCISFKSTHDLSVIIIPFSYYKQRS